MEEPLLLLGRDDGWEAAARRDEEEDQHDETLPNNHLTGLNDQSGRSCPHVCMAHHLPPTYNSHTLLAMVWFGAVAPHPSPGLSAPSCLFTQVFTGSFLPLLLLFYSSLISPCCSFSFPSLASSGQYSTCFPKNGSEVAKAIMGRDCTIIMLTRT